MNSFNTIRPQIENQVKKSKIWAILPLILFAHMIFLNLSLLAADEAQEQKLFWTGELKYRHQVEAPQIGDERSMERMGAKLGLKSILEPNLTLYFQLMTGTKANSGNQTLGDDKDPGFSRRSIGLNWAYFEYQPLEIPSQTQWSLLGGKMKSPFYFVGKNQIILDRDISPEGLASTIKLNINDQTQLWLNLGSFWIKEMYDTTYSKDQTDIMLNAGQLFLHYQIETVEIIAGYGQFSYIGLRDNPPTVTGNGSSPNPPGVNPNGNTLDLLNNYPTNFDLEEAALEVKAKFANYDLGVFAETIKNVDADSLRDAQAYGLSVSSGSLTLSYSIIKCEKDAVVAAFTDSDFNNGKVSAKGHILGVGYKFSKQAQLQISQYQSQSPLDEASGSPVDLRRTHLDILFGF